MSQPIRQHAARDSVVIAGAGPSGLVCALFLVRAGVPVTILEQAQGLPEDMRASTLHPATLDLLEGTGVVRTLLAQGTRVPRWQYLRHGSDERIVFDLGLLEGLTRHPFRLQVEQFRLTSAIVERLRDEPGFRLRRGARVTGVHQEDGAVTVRFEEHGEERAERCRWLVAADGAWSTVRQSLGLALEGGSRPLTSISLVLDHRFQDDLPGLLGVNYVWTNTGDHSLVRVRDLWRFIFSPDDENPPVKACDQATAQARLQQVYPREAPYRIQQLNSYTVQPGCLERFRSGRVLFCGDSAHLSSPVGGMGMNSGIHDAACLVEHLLAVFEGAGPGHLDRYDRRRRTIAREEIQRLSSLDQQRQRERDPARRESIWRELGEIAADRDRQRDFLLDSAMIRSREREKDIE